MKYAVSEEGVNAMQSAANAISEAVEEMMSLVQGVQGASDEYADTIGPHKASLDSALEELSSNIQSASEPANNVVDTLNDVADAYSEIIGNDPFSGLAGN